MASFLTSFMSLLFITIFSCYLPLHNALQVTYDNRALKINGQRKFILSGSIHYPRSTAQMWPSLIRKAKEGGLNTIETYVFWNAHEPNYREYDFSGNKDLIQFLKAVQNEGLYTMLRIGPYVCAEWNYGGFPVWLHNMPNITFRTNNAVFKREMGIFTKKIVDMVKGEKLFGSQGGNIILAQIENEYGNIIWHYGEEGKKYINWCADFALSLNIGVPWIMCQEDDAPKTMISTCNGFYCDQFWPKNKNNPKFWTENWSGWFKNWGDGNPHRPAEDLAFAVARFFQYGGSLQNYYMYHGGTNFGRTSGGPYIATTYDYNAPLDEYGNVNQPKWGHLKELHNLLYSLEDVLLYGNATNTDYGRMMSSTVYEYKGKRACFLGNANDKDDISITFEGRNYTTPAWSVTILPDCKTEVYNTARVNVQTTLMVKKLSEKPLKWSYRPETVMHLKYGDKERSSVLIDALDAKQLFDQKVVTNDTTDYLWYMTSFKVNKSSPIMGQETTLQINTKSHVLHAFLNNKHIGSEWAQGGKYQFSFERNVKLRDDINTISLLSETVGLPNYGEYFEKVGQGVIGPVKIVEPNGEGLDLSKNTWTYMVGIHGISKGLYELDDHNKLTWHKSDFQTNRMFIWYKTFFKTPAGEDAVVLDLTGMGKGVAWVNGHNIGRYWPSFLAKPNCPKCDYRGTYGGSKCVTNCGQPSQRWYHVPRSFLRKGKNQLILFEEMGGRPQEVSVQTVVPGTICAKVQEGKTLELSCQGRKMSKIKFASFGEPKGSCGSFERSDCDATNAMAVVQGACVGKEKCTINVSEGFFPTTTCSKDKLRSLAIEATC